MSGQEWWPDGTPKVGDPLAADLATRVLDVYAADRVIDAAVKNAITMIRAGRPHIRYYEQLRGAIIATSPLLDQPR